MCFSAGASFTTGAVLMVAGGATLTQVTARSQLMLALIPWAFAVQQVLEGTIWLGINQGANDVVLSILAGGYLFFAYIFWPLWIPISLFMLEESGWRRALLLILATLGAVFAICALITTFDFTPHVIDNHLAYGEFPTNKLITLAYLCATIAPFFIMRRTAYKIAGALIVACLAISWLISYTAIGSLWCFFAAALSVFDLMLLRVINGRGIFLR